ncbi:MAG: cation transporter [Nitrospiraceae bacterium]|nr:MAG: cation transporter [Nitrospiraceae bacterium]
MTRLRSVRQVLLYTLALNVTVAAAKVAYGYYISSISMLSDGFHSLADGTSNIIGLAGIWIASRPPDETHPYGHRKFENLSIIAIAVLIFGAGIEILREAYHRIQHPVVIDVTALSFIIMAATMSVNTFVMVYESRRGRELKSDFLVADALHTKTDIFISFSVIASLAAARLGYPVIDLIAALVIVLFIIRMGFSVLRSAAGVLTDAACLDPRDVQRIAHAVEGVKGSHHIRTRGNEDHMNIDMHIFVDPEASIEYAHGIAHSVEEAIKGEIPGVKDVVIHIEPYRGKGGGK